MTAARIAVAAVAVLVLAWLALMLRDWRLQEDGAAALRPGSDARAAGAGRARPARRRGCSTPTRRPDMNLALLASARGQPERALAGIEDVVRREPDNLSAWAILAVLARDRRGGARAGVRRPPAARPAQRSLITTSAPARTSAGRLTAGSCQSQSIEAWRSQTSAAAAAPAAAAGSRRSAVAGGEQDAGEERGERQQPDEAELGELLELERVDVAHGLADLALLQPADAEAAGAEPAERDGRRTRRGRRASTRSGSSSPWSGGWASRRRPARRRSGARRARRSTRPATTIAPPASATRPSRAAPGRASSAGSRAAIRPQQRGGRRGDRDAAGRARSRRRARGRASVPASDATPGERRGRERAGDAPRRARARRRGAGRATARRRRAPRGRARRRRSRRARTRGRRRRRAATAAAAASDPHPGAAGCGRRPRARTSTRPIAASAPSAFQ